MGAKDDIIVEYEQLQELHVKIVEAIRNEKFNTHEFAILYQRWYSRALQLVSFLGPDSLDEFVSYYLPDSKRKEIDPVTYTIKDLIGGISISRLGEPVFDHFNTGVLKVLEQHMVFSSLEPRLESTLLDIEGHLRAEIQDDELDVAESLIKINLRAAGSLAGVVLESHSQRVLASHRIKTKKTRPSLSDLNDLLKDSKVYDTVQWRKIQHLTDIRNYCSHKKEREPTKEEVQELVAGVRGVIKTIF